MSSLKRFYFNLAAGIAQLTHNKLLLDKLNNDTPSRVSRDVNYYRTHFFNM